MTVKRVLPIPATLIEFTARGVEYCFNFAQAGSYHNNVFDVESGVKRLADIGGLNSELNLAAQYAVNAIGQVDGDWLIDAITINGPEEVEAAMAASAATRARGFSCFQARNRHRMLDTILEEFGKKNEPELTQNALAEIGNGLRTIRQSFGTDPELTQRVKNNVNFFTTSPEHVAMMGWVNVDDRYPCLVMAYSHDKANALLGGLITDGIANSRERYRNPR